MLVGFGGPGVYKTVKPFEPDGGSVNDYRTDLDLTVAGRKTQSSSVRTHGELCRTNQSPRRDTWNPDGVDGLSGFMNRDYYNKDKP